MIYLLLAAIIFAFFALGTGILILAICAVAALCRCKSVRPENPFRNSVSGAESCRNWPAPRGSACLWNASAGAILRRHQARFLFIARPTKRA